MDITLDKKDQLEALIKITLNETDYQPKVEEKVKQYAKKADIKGFRKGMVPPSVIKKMYGKSLLVEEVNHLLSHSLQDYIRENKLRILGEPIPNFEKHNQIDWDTTKTFEFEYNVGMVDDFKLDVSSKQKVKGYTIEVNDEIINETITNLQKQHGKMNNPELSEEGDSLYGELKNTDGSFAKDLLIDLDKVEKKVRVSLIGVKKDQTVEFDIRKAFKEDQDMADVLSISIKEAKDLKGNFNFTIRNVNRVDKASLNQELFDKIFGKDSVKSEEEFREKVKEEIQKGYDKEADRFLEQSIVKYFVDDTKIALPDEFLKKWLLYSNEGKVTNEDIEKEYPSYMQELKWSLIKNKITETNEIKAEHEDVIEKTKELIRTQFGMGLSPQLEANMDSFVDNYLKGNEGENYMKIYNQVLSQKIFKHIKDQISIQDKKIKPKEFQKLVME